MNYKNLSYIQTYRTMKYVHICLFSLLKSFKGDNNLSHSKYPSNTLHNNFVTDPPTSWLILSAAACRRFLPRSDRVGSSMLIIFKKLSQKSPSGYSSFGTSSELDPAISMYYCPHNICRSINSVIATRAITVPFLYAII